MIKVKFESDTHQDLMDSVMYFGLAVSAQKNAIVKERMQAQMEKEQAVAEEYSEQTAVVEAEAKQPPKKSTKKGTTK